MEIWLCSSPWLLIISKQSRTARPLAQLHISACNSITWALFCRVSCCAYAAPPGVPILTKTHNDVPSKVAAHSCHFQECNSCARSTKMKDLLAVLNLHTLLAHSDCLNGPLASITSGSRAVIHWLGLLVRILYAAYKYHPCLLCLRSSSSFTLRPRSLGLTA